MSGTAVAALALTGLMVLSACAKDSGGTTAATGVVGAGCEFATPPAAPAAATTSAAGRREAEGEQVDGSALKIGLAYDIGGRGDASFNDLAAAGFDRAIQDMGVRKENTREVSAAPAEDESVKQSRLRQLAREGFDPIVGVGFAYTEALRVVAPEFPDVRFGLVDSAVEGAANVTPLVFAEQEGAFLAGVVAAYQSKKCHVGFVGGVDIPLIRKFEAGYTQGARAAAPKVVVDKKYITPATDFSGFQDPAKGLETAKGLIAEGADVLYPAAGASGIGVFSAVKQAGVLAVGCDADQYNQPSLADSRDVIVASSLKRVDVAVYDFFKAAARNDLASLPKVFDLKVDGVGYATSGGRIDAKLQGILEGFKAQIIQGSIKVADKP
ncbi:BMP family lipoprotein [Saccharothrix coeruleofusca]|uniref:BMP family ABC transporter substrate-binding protein n=1 Tax=Saccharothrix coeruleofusca TaxID=33919 RepID=A0A918AU21_9PSEU|nr:BMP family ABC transporter substrate-binding protein [Saccharothrix coeruleofusca]GGP51745.1 BMP family ABC transporter substrate-binding protein [Saccharothrix coeruleofusca]GGP85082.1 BMP family ABC transporter substrate-binding protein [Saccharothrix coeruleofusca]